MRHLVLLPLLTACTAAPSLLLEPDRDADGLHGARGPFGVGEFTTRSQIRVEESLRTTLVFPADRDARLDETGAPWPAVVLVHGGFVAPDRYTWLAAHVASRGYVVILPDHPLRLALLSSGNAWASLQRARDVADGVGGLAGLIDPDAPAVFAGHSLGGVVASSTWLQRPDDVAGLALLASFPAEGADVEAGTDAPVLALTGGADGLVAPEELSAPLARFPGETWLGVVDGMTHFDWTDDPRPGELARDGERTRDLEAVRADAAAALDRFLDAALGDAPLDAVDDDDAGITWSRP